jgi:hypothetical protein
MTKKESNTLPFHRKMEKSCTLSMYLMTETISYPSFLREDGEKYSFLVPENGDRISYPSFLREYGERYSFLVPENGDKISYPFLKTETDDLFLYVKTETSQIPVSFL